MRCPVSSMSMSTLRMARVTQAWVGCVAVPSMRTCRLVWWIAKAGRNQAVPQDPDAASATDDISLIDRCAQLHT